MSELFLRFLDAFQYVVNSDRAARYPGVYAFWMRVEAAGYAALALLAFVQAPLTEAPSILFMGAAASGLAVLEARRLDRKEEERIIREEKEMERRRAEL